MFHFTSELQELQSELEHFGGLFSKSPFSSDVLQLVSIALSDSMYTIADRYRGGYQYIHTAPEQCHLSYRCYVGHPVSAAPTPPSGTWSPLTRRLVACHHVSPCHHAMVACVLEQWDRGAYFSPLQWLPGEWRAEKLVGMPDLILRQDNLPIFLGHLKKFF